MFEEANKIAEEIKDDERSATQLPKPSGYHILLALPKSDDKFESGLVKADLTMQREEISTVVGFVLEAGGDAYKDERFKSAWCKKGDFVLVGAYKGTRFRIHGQEFRRINDDDVLGVVEDPRGYSRA
jgi:co-chaperonin GroES (HSP10)